MWSTAPWLWRSEVRNVTDHLSAGARILGVLVCDVLAAVLPAYLLWETGVTNVAAGPASTFVLVIVVVALMVVFRAAVVARGNPRDQLFVSWGHTALLGAVVVTWQITDSYYVGWQAAYASSLLAVGSIFGLLGAIADLPRAPGGQTRTNASLSSSLRQLLLMTVAVLGVIITSSIHEWKPEILNPVFLTMAVGIGAGLVGRAVTFGSGSRPASAASLAEARDAGGPPPSFEG